MKRDVLDTSRGQDTPASWTEQSAFDGCAQ
jgi:hypothetical protein